MAKSVGPSLQSEPARSAEREANAARAGQRMNTLSGIALQYILIVNVLYVVKGRPLPTCRARAAIATNCNLFACRFHAGERERNKLKHGNVLKNARGTSTRARRSLPISGSAESRDALYRRRAAQILPVRG